MQTEKLLSKLKGEIDAEIGSFFDGKIETLKREKKSEEIVRMVELLKKFVMRGGKRIRPILFCIGYYMAGGKKKEIVRASTSVELMHTYLLIHDDIIDRDGFRHGDLSLHKRYKQEYSNIARKEECNRFGVSLAIIAGDLVSGYAYEQIASKSYSGDAKDRVIKKMIDINQNTIVGEGMDVILAEKKIFTYEEIIEMQKYKTAKYTIEGPLHLGAILAGKNDEFLRSISEFSIPLGVAYQIQDDIMGMFGSKERIGKPVGSDVKEGKKTLLILKADEKADANQKKALFSILGKRDVTSEEVEKVKSIIRDTGSLEYSKNLMVELKKKALKGLEKMKIDKEYKIFFREFADMMVKREY